MQIFLIFTKSKNEITPMKKMIDQDNDDKIFEFSPIFPPFWSKIITQNKYSFGT